MFGVSGLADDFELSDAFEDPTSRKQSFLLNISLRWIEFLESTGLKKRTMLIRLRKINLLEIN